MTTEISENDEEIHHSLGKDFLYSCPSSLTFALSGASSSPINISPLITISPPGMTIVLEQQKLEQGKHLCWAKRFIKHFFRPQLNVYLSISELNITRQIFNSESVLVSNTIKNMFNNCTLNNCTFNTHNVTDSSLNGEHTRQQAAEVMDVEVVKYEGEDHSNSPLIPCLTHPEQAQPLIEWLHRSMANQSSDRDTMLPFKAAFEKHLLKRVPHYEDFKKEFGDIVCQSQYSRLMGNEGKYTEDEFKRVLASLKL